MIYVADTHSLVWFLTEDKKLGKEVLVIFQNTDAGKSVIVIPTIVIAEVMYIAESKDAAIKFSDLLEKLKQSVNYIVFDLDLEVLIEMQYYKKLKDIHDRIIVATASITKSKLITKDKNIKDSSYVETIW